MNFHTYYRCHHTIVVGILHLFDSLITLQEHEEPSFSDSQVSSLMSSDEAIFPHAKMTSITSTDRFDFNQSPAFQTPNTLSTHPITHTQQ